MKDLKTALHDGTIQFGDKVIFGDDYTLCIDKEGNLVRLDGKSFILNINDLKRDDYIILKAEQKALTVREQAKEIASLLNCEWQMLEPYIFNVDENGQSKQLKNHEPYIKDLRTIIYTIQNSRVGRSPSEVYCEMSFDKQRIDLIAENLKNLKPID